MEPKVHQSAQKKSRVACPPIKVRKEKLGDRIAALQQLVAPFGKTDTASVLMEAIGYIKFLQNQVEGPTEDGTEDPKRDLRSHGLCLMPLSCLSYVTDGGGGIWPPVA
ncbi:basic helix-loop-helix (bHLH) DNA-binding superfamily protein [Actinidia rufa]|uniref:Basic helix-loop-helix (BHLH) DNA-binding superfamily protein n=1 Tax=Actinidia rufa TaxID=165716 RepID=A0A7J0EJR5_9ERIC|nr:basic helix-loop-helix (bHLH) DNA-binding superfamily protein [Actinidia rufa]